MLLTYLNTNTDNFAKKQNSKIIILFYKYVLNVLLTTIVINKQARSNIFHNIHNNVFIITRCATIQKFLKKFLKNSRQKIHLLTTNKVVRLIVKNTKYRLKKKKLYIVYKKWKNIKWLFKKTKKLSNKIRIKYATKKLTKLTKMLFKTIKIKKLRNTVFKKNQMHSYRYIRRMSLNKFKKLFFIWKKTKLHSNVFFKNDTKQNKRFLKKKTILSNMFHYIFTQILKRSTIKKMRKIYKIRPKYFIKLQHKKLNIVFFKKKNQATNDTIKYYNKKNTFKNYFNLINYYKINSRKRHKNRLQIKFCKKAYNTKNYKFFFWKRLLNTSKKFSIKFNEINNIYIDNLSLLNTSIFKSTKYNYKLVNALKHHNVGKHHVSLQNRTDNYNAIYTKTATNYVPLFFYTNLGIAGSNRSNSMHVNRYNQFLKNTNIQNYKFFFMIYMLNFLEKYTNKKIWFQIDIKNFFTGFWKNYTQLFQKKNSYLYRKFNKFINTQECLEILIVSFIKQDLQMFLLYLKKILENSHFKRHKKILSIFFDILRKNKKLLKLTGIAGFSFDIRGKVGVSGNAKKRHIFFSAGKISTTSQNLKSQWQQINIWTPTGQMGITCLLQS